MNWLVILYSINEDEKKYYTVYTRTLEKANELAIAIVEKMEAMSVPVLLLDIQLIG
jgi:hypothetical protein